MKQASPLSTKPVYIHESDAVRSLVDKGIEEFLQSNPSTWPAPDEVARGIVDKVFAAMRPKLQGEVRELFLNYCKYITGQPASVQEELGQQ